MSITVNGRLIQVILKNNTGDPDIDGTELDISNLLLELGDINWNVDDNLTKLSVGNLTIKCTDDNSSTLQNFLENSITSTKGILPPWIFLYIDGNLTFTGLLFESPVITKSSSDLTIELSAINWATMLTYKYIKQNDPDYTRLNEFKTGVAYAAGTSVNAYSAYNKELQRGHYLNMVVVDISNQGQYNVGDWVYVNNYSTYLNYNQKYQIIGIQVQPVGGLTNTQTLCLWLGSNFQWQTAGKGNYGQQTTLYRVYQTTSNVLDTVSNLPKFVCNENWPPVNATNVPKYSILLTYTDGLQPGDTLNLLVTGSDTASSMTITDVDNVNNYIYLDQPINFNLSAGVTSFELSVDSLNQAVLQPIMPLIDKALIGVASSDFSSFVPSTVPSPALSFINPNSYYGQNTNTERLTGVSWIQPTLTDFEVLGPTNPNNLSWQGLPDTGWIAEASNSWIQTEPWTSHTSTPPSSLMPLLPTPADADPSFSRKSLGNVHNPNNFNDSMDAAYPYYIFCYDYTTLRGYSFRFFSGVCTSATYQTWNGSVWSSATTLSTSIGVPISILPLYGSSSSIGSGCGLIALYEDGTLKTLYTSTAQSSISLPPDAWKVSIYSANTAGGTQIKYLAAGMTLTANGIYYSTPSGYGKVSVSGGVLSQVYCNLFNIQSLTNINSSIISVAPLINCMVYSNGEVEALTNITYAGSGSNVITDTYLLQLNPNPQQSALDSCYMASFICHSLPRTGMMVKSPVSDDVFGFLGSRLFIISKTLPLVVERFTLTSQTAQSIIEFICTITNSVASPLISGKLKIISRDFVKTPVNLNIDMVSILENRWNKHMANTFVIQGDNSSLGVAVSTTQLAGLTVSYNNSDWIKNSSQAQAIAESYLSFFEKPRHELEQEWFSSTTPAPWESLEPLDIVTINGGATQYLVTSLSYNLDSKTAKATLLELL